MLIIARHRALSTRPAQAAAHTRAPPPADRGRRSPHCSSTLTGHLKMSLTFSPACLALPAAWSLWPSASRSRSSVALPSASLPCPASSWALFCNLSVPLMGNPFSVVVRGQYPTVGLGTPASAEGPGDVLRRVTREAGNPAAPASLPSRPSRPSRRFGGRGHKLMTAVDCLRRHCLGSARRTLSDSVPTAV